MRYTKRTEVTLYDKPIVQPNQLIASENGTFHIYDGKFLTESDEPFSYWLWNDGDQEDSDPDSINDEPWSKLEIFNYLKNNIELI